MEPDITWINTVKIAGNGYLVNGNMNVPNSTGNRHYRDVAVWLETNLAEPEFNQTELDTQAYNDWKASRTTAVSEIEVTYDSVVYQGDEISQERMSRAITAAADDVETIGWIAKDNSINLLTRVDLKIILKDAGDQQSALWVDGRP